MAVGSGLNHETSRQGFAIALAGVPHMAQAQLSAGLGIVIEVDRPDVFRFAATKLGVIGSFA